MTAKYRAYPEYKNSGAFGLDNIPVSWIAQRIKFLFHIGRGRVIAQDELEDDGAYPVYSSQTIDDGRLGYINTFDFDCKQITWTTDGANAGTVFIREGKHNCTNVCGTLQPKSQRYNLKFFLYCLQYVTQFYKRPDTNGAKIMNGEMAEIFVTLPSENEQSTIVNFLDHETAKIDTLIEKQQQLIKLLQEKRQAVISHAVTKGLNPNAPMRDSGVEWLGEVPEHWGVGGLRWYLNISSGDFLSNENFNISQDECFSIPVIGGNGVMGYTNIFNQNEILVIGRVGALCGNVHYISEPCWVTDNALKVELDGRLIPEYAKLYLDALNLNKLANRNAQPLITGAMIKDQMTVIPPIAEQEKIVCVVNEASRKIDELIVKSEQAIELMKERRTALISAAVTGKIDVRDWQAPGAAGNTEAAA